MSGFSQKITQGHFDHVFSENPAEDPLDLNFVRNIFREQDLSGKKILDLGCGLAGGRSLFFADEKKVSLYVGADLSLKALRISKNTSPAAFFVQADIDSPPFCEEAFDVIYCRGAITYTEKPEQAVKDIWRLLKKEGQIFVDFSRDCAVVRVINIISRLVSPLPSSIKSKLSGALACLICLFLRSLIGEKAAWKNRKKMRYVLLSSLFTPTKLRSFHEKSILDLFNFLGAKKIDILNIADSPVYSNKTTFSVMARKGAST